MQFIKDFRIAFRIFLIKNWIGRYILFCCLGNILLGFLIFSQEIQIEVLNKEPYAVFLSFSILYTYKDLIIFYLFGLFTVYLIEFYEIQGQANKRYISLPIDFFDLYTSRFLIIVCLWIIFWGASAMSWWAISLWQHYEGDKLWLTYQTDYFFRFYLPLWLEAVVGVLGYMAWVVLFSFFVPKIYIGLVQLFVCLLLGVLQISQLPFSLPFKKLPNFEAKELLPSSYIYFSLAWVFFTFFLVYIFRKNFFYHFVKQ